MMGRGKPPNALRANEVEKEEEEEEEEEEILGKHTIAVKAMLFPVI
jgi:hypothetical protein